MLGMIVAAFIVFAMAILGMAVGVMFNNRCLKGSCGGLSSLPKDSGRSVCDACSSTPYTGKKEETSEKEPAAH